jgi:hypothetical protein
MLKGIMEIKNKFEAFNLHTDTCTLPWNNNSTARSSLMTSPLVATDRADPSRQKRDVYLK